MKKPVNRPFGLLLSLVSALLLTCVTHALAQPQLMPNNPQQTVQQWSQVLYCQQAYAHPDNKSRVYAYDQQQCQLAEEQIKQPIQNFPDDVQDQLKKLAQRDARKIMSNTPDIAQVLPTCRQTCQKYAAAAIAESGLGTSPSDQPEASGEALQ